VPNVKINPADVAVSLPIRLLGGFKNAAVKVVTKGQVADGYRLTSISVSPPTVTLFSDDPNAIDEIPGYVETLPVDLTNLSDDVEISTGLNLPENVTLVREPSVLVQVSVAAIEGSLTITVPVEPVNLSPELQADISPATVDVIVSGPLNLLDQLSPANFRVIVDLGDLPPGVYQRQVVVDLQPDEVRVQTTLPESGEVTLELAPTPTPLGTPSATELPEITPLLTPTLSAQP
jgi:YbbR domain-containing protein